MTATYNAGSSSRAVLERARLPSWNSSGSSSANTSRRCRKRRASSSAGAIYHIQRELESVAETENAAVVLCDRGAVDCSAYWTGDGDLFSAVGTTRAIELARYDTVIHLRTPTSPHAYNRDNPLRLESIEEAAAIDVQIAAEWSGHPHRLVVEPTEDFLHKAARALALLRDEVPECCQHHVRRFFWDDRVNAEPGP